MLEHGVHLFIWLVHFERLSAKILRKIIEGNSLECFFMNDPRPFDLLILHEVACFLNCCLHLRIPLHQAVFELGDLLPHHHHYFFKLIVFSKHSLVVFSVSLAQSCPTRRCWDELISYIVTAANLLFHLLVEQLVLQLSILCLHILNHLKQLLVHLRLLFPHGFLRVHVACEQVLWLLVGIVC